MSSITQLRCSQCGDPVASFVDETNRYGRCCANLPYRWTESGRSIGIALPVGDHPSTSLAEIEDVEDEDDIASSVTCSHCGRTEFRYCVSRIEYLMGDRHDASDVVDGVLQISAENLDYSDSETQDDWVECTHCRTPLDSDLYHIIG